MSMLASSDASRFDELRLTRLRRVNAIAPSPCGTWLAVAVSRLDKDESKYVSDLWRVSLTDPTEPPRQLSRGDCNDTCPRFRSDGSLAFLSDRNPRNAEPLPGDRNRNQVWLLPPDMGEPVPLTDEPLGVSDFRFASATGDLFLITDVFLGIPHDRQRTHADDLAKRGPSGMHYTTLPVRHWNYWIPTAAPHLISYAGGERRDLTPVADREHREIDFGVEWNVAPDGSRAAIAVTRRGPRRIGDTALRLIDTATGQSVDLGTVDDTTHSEPCFAPDSAALACVRSVRASRKADRRVLWLFDQEDMQRGGQGRAVAADWNAWPTLHCFDGSSSALIATADVDGTAPVFRVDITTGEATRLSADSAGGCHTGLMLTGGAIVGLRHRLLHPPEPFILPMSADGEPTLLATLSGFTEADGAALATWESFTVVSDDGAKVQSFLLQPRAPGPHPALLWIHGGPLSQYADGWHWRWNPLVAVSSGYAVALPNPRGSTGGGHELIQGIWNNEWGGACYRDLMTVVASIAARPEIDGERIAAMGGSFGGYMTNWIGVSTDRFRCLVTHAGIYSLSAFTGTTDYPPYMHHEMSTNPYQDPEGFDRYSPHRRLERWKSPTLVIHGEKDYRVPIGEALHLFEALDWRGVDVELLIFPDEGHWILRPQNVRLWYRTVLEFLDKHMSRD